MFGGPTSRRREVGGPGVGSVAVIAKPPRTRPADHLILEGRRREEARQEAQRMVHDNHVGLGKARFEIKTDARLQQQAIDRRMHSILQDDLAKLERRRERLRAMLAEEEAGYMQEIADSGETKLERQAKMRERARQLREQREQERQELAKIKTDQLYMQNCEPLRALRSQQEHEALLEERNAQIEERQRIREHEQLVDDIYSQMWEQDRLAKEQRAAAEEEKRRKEAEHQRSILSQQIAASEAQRAYEAQLVEEEKKLRLEELELMQEEERRREVEKREQQKRRAAELDRYNRESVRRRTEIMQAEMEADLKLMEHVMASGMNEASEMAQRKRQTQEEMRLYLDHIRETKRLEAERAAHIDQLRMAEINRTMQKQIDKWDREAAARKKLMDEVVATRREQIAAKIEENKRLQLEYAREAQEMEESAEEFKKAEAEKAAQEREKARKQREMLAEQARHQRELREEARRREDEEVAAIKRQEAAVQARLEEEMMQFSLRGTSVRSTRRL